MNINQLMKVVYDNYRPVAARLLVTETTKESDQQYQFNLANVTAVTIAGDKQKSIVRMGLLFADGFTLTADFFRDDALCIELLADFNKGKQIDIKSTSFFKDEWNDDEKITMKSYREAEERTERQYREKKREYDISIEKFSLIIFYFFPMVLFAAIFIEKSDIPYDDAKLYILRAGIIMMLFSMTILFISNNLYNSLKKKIKKPFISIYTLFINLINLLKINKINK